MRRWGGTVLFLPAVVYLAAFPAGVPGRALAEAASLAGLLFLLLRQNVLLRSRIPPGHVPLLLLGALAAFQIVPLPPFILELLSPLNAEWYGRSIWLMEPEAAMSLSIRPKSTLIIFFRLASGVALFFIAASCLADRERAKNLILVLCGATSLAALTALAVLLAPSWNHLQIYIPSGLFATLIPLGAGLYLAERPETAFGTLRERVVEALLRPASRPDILAALSVILGAAVLMMTSGPWFLGGVAGLCTFALLLLFRRGRRVDAVPVLTTAVFLAAGGIALNGTEGVFPSPWTLAHFPAIFGAGFGAADLLPGIESAAPDGIMKFIVEGGGAGVVLAGLFLFALYGRTLMSWRHRKRRFPIYVVASALASAAVPVIAAVALALSPDDAVFFLFFVLAGLASATSRRSADSSTLGAPSRSLHYSVTAVVIAVLAGNLLFALGIFSAAAVGATDLQRAVRFDPMEEGYRLALGRAALLQGNGEKALESYGDAVRLSPLTGESLQGVALSCKALGRNEEAGRLLEASLGLGSGMSEGYKLYVDWLLASKRLPEGKAAIQNALNKYPGDTVHYLGRLGEAGLSLPEMKSILPRRFTVFTLYGSYLDRHGLSENAADSFRVALACYPKEPPDPDALAQVASWFAGTGRTEDALATVREGLRRSPGDQGLRRLAAASYEKVGLTVRAEEERRALRLMQGK